MFLDTQVLALINLIVQLLLIVMVGVAVYLVKVKRQLLRHCKIMRFAIPIQLVAIAFVMLPSLLGYVLNETPSSFMNVEIQIHHGLGLLVIALWIYINLAFKGIIKTRWRLVIPMRLALGSWIVTLVMGVHLYFSIWI